MSRIFAASTAATAAVVVTVGLVTATASLPQSSTASTTSGASSHLPAKAQFQLDLVSKKRKPLALVYKGPAACSSCSSAAAKLVRSTKPRFRVAYVGPRQRLKINSRTLRRAALYVQPGGDTSVDRANRLLGSKARSTIRGYVRSGGRYLGLCQGGYLAGSKPGMNLLRPGNSGQYITSPGALTRSARDTVIPVRFGKRTYRVYFQDGPYFERDHSRGVRVMSRYTNGRSAVLVKKYGAGRIAVVGFHPEAPSSWYRAIGAKDRSDQGRSIGKRIIHELMK